MKNLLVRLGPKAPRYYVQIMAFILIVTYMITDGRKPYHRRCL